MPVAHTFGKNGKVLVSENDTEYIFNFVLSGLIITTPDGLDFTVTQPIVLPFQNSSIVTDIETDGVKIISTKTRIQFAGEPVTTFQCCKITDSQENYILSYLNVIYDILDEMTV